MTSGADTVDSKRLQGRRWARLAWIGLVAWQFLWLAVLPEPLGKRSLVWAALTVVPLLLPLRGILKLEARGLIWGGYLALFAAMFGIMELWVSPAERPAAGLQLLLCLAYLAALTIGTRKPPKP